MTIEIISWSISIKVWDRAGIQLVSCTRLPTALQGPLVRRPNSTLDLRCRCTSSMCEQSLCKVRTLWNEICCADTDNTQLTLCKHSKGGVDVIRSKFNTPNILSNVHKI